MSTRQTVLFSIGVLVLLALGAWWYFGFSLDFMRFFAAEPGVTGTTTTTTNTVPSRGGVPAGCTAIGAAVTCDKVACAAQQSTVTVGAIVTIQAYGGTGGYAFAAPGGVIATADTAGTSGSTDTVGVRYDAPGAKQVFVTAKRASDPTQTDVATCPVTVVVGAVTN